MSIIQVILIFWSWKREVSGDPVLQAAVAIRGLITSASLPLSRSRNFGPKFGSVVQAFQGHMSGTYICAFFPKWKFQIWTN